MSRLFPLLAAALLLATIAVAPGLRDFRVDASTESLVLEDDPDGARYDQTRLLFASDEFVLVGLTRPDLFRPEGVAAVASLHAQFAGIPGVERVDSIVSVPLVRSFSAPLAPLLALGKQATLTSPGIDLEKAREELTHHALFRGNLIAEDGQTAGLLVTLQSEPAHREAARAWQACLQARSEAKRRLAAAREPAEQAAAVRALAAAQAAVDEERPRYTTAEDDRKAKRIAVVRAIRNVVEQARGRGEDARASGVPALVVEMVEAIEQDLRRFLVFSALFVIGFLSLVFRRPRWVLLPMVAAGATAVWTVWTLLALGKRVTVITANVPSLLLVIGLAHSIHLIVRWRELLVRYPDEPRPRRVARLVRELVWPCLFTGTTTAVGFLSLYYAGSRPIIDFGFLMALGVGLSFLFSFIVIPGALLVLPAREPGALERSARALTGLGRFSLRRRGLVLVGALLLAGMSGWGASKLEVEARFIDYFDPSTELYRGLLFIDRRLGGTSGLEVILSGEGAAFGPRHADHLQQAAELADWLRERREIGAVMSYVGLLDEVRKLLPQAPRGQVAFMLAQQLPPERLRALLGDYVVLDKSQLGEQEIDPYGAVRIVARVHETDPGLSRAQLLREVRGELARRFPPESGVRAEVTGMFVLYANMLQSLMGSQVTTSVLALSAILIMLAALFRSLRAGVLALIPNLLPIGIVLGAMGWAGIPLDMATVMIASVSLGIGVDCAIHYLFRVREELARDGDLEQALLRSHASIGTSIVYTSLTSVVGFAVLGASAFRPNAYFGVLTGVAMVAALFGMLTLLPVLLTLSCPFPRGSGAGADQVPQP